MEWLDRSEALERLGVRAQTLYAYVSRGMIEVRSDPLDSRRSRYSASDIATLLTRRKRGRGVAAIAKSTIDWGEPLVETKISTIDRGKLIYRGIDAIAFAATATLEEAAALLWGSATPVIFPSGASASDPFTALAALVATAPAGLGRGRERLCEDAAVVTASLVSAFGGAATYGPIHDRLVRGWSLDSAAGDGIRRLLVLLADHDLNASTFATRVTVSSGASVAAGQLAGLATLSGPRHGGAAAELAGLAAEVEREGARAAVDRWLSLDRPIPGFGHPLYPDGDPRAAAVVSRVEVDATLAALADVVRAETGITPNIDFALAAFCRAYRLPADGPFRLFAVGRSVGWAAHAVEQLLEGALIRPRGRYTGPQLA